MEQIKASDLRIGNWVFNCEEYVQITGVQQDRIFFRSGWQIIDEDCPAGIPLTPAILEVAGFVIRSSILTVYDGRTLSNYRLNAIWIYVYSDGEIKVTSGSGAREHAWIKYLHQLQNLYYSLVGKELAITL